MSTPRLDTISYHDLIAALLREHGFVCRRLGSYTSVWWDASEAVACVCDIYVDGSILSIYPHSFKSLTGIKYDLANPAFDPQTVVDLLKSMR